MIEGQIASAEELDARHDRYLALIDLLKIRARTVGDIVRQAVPYFAAEIAYEEQAARQHWKDAGTTADLLRATRERLASVEPWTTEAMEAALRELADARGIAAGKIFQPLRVALTGMSVSPGIFEVLVVMGRPLALRRLDNALRWLDGRSEAA
jgi:glutamyl-tRNA synthetase